MTELICAPLGAGAYDALAKKIIKSVKLGEKSILIVPEQATLALERNMSKILPANSPLYFEVTNFTRLANRVERELGGLSAKPSDRARRALVMWDTVAELSPVLRVLAPKNGISASLVNRAISAINEIEAFGADADKIEEAAVNAKRKNPRLADKLADISLIMPLYKKKLLEAYGDTGDELYKLIDILDKNPGYVVAKRVFIYGFTSFTEAQYRLISRLMGTSEICVCFDLPPADDEAFEYTEPRAARQRIKAIAARGGHSVKLTKIPPRDEAKSPILSEVASLLWHTNATIDNDYLQYKDDLRIFAAKDPYEKCDQIAADIREKINTGARYSDIAIIARNTDKYIGTLDNALIKCSIPHFISKPKDVSSFDAVKLLYSAISAVSREYKLEDVLTYAKCGLLGIDREACDEFELYCEKWQIDKLFPDSVLCFELSPSGYSLGNDKEDRELLSKINETYNTIVKSLHFLSFGSDEPTVRAYAATVVNFLEGIDADRKIKEKAAKLRALGETEAAEDEEEILKIIYSALDLMVSASGDSFTDINSFKSRLEIVLSEAKLGRIPSNLDEVLIGDANMLRPDGVRHVYLIGCNSGEFPAMPTDSSYFTDRDKLELSEMGVYIEENTEFLYSKELFYFTRALACAKESATIFYTSEDFAFHELERSEVIDRIVRLTGGEISPVSVSSLPLSKKIYSPDAALEAYTETGNQKLREALYTLGFENELTHRGESVTNESLTLSNEAVNAMNKGDLYLSQTRIDKFIDCPLSYFLNYTLALSDNEIISFDAKHIGSFIHQAFEKYFLERARIKEEGGTPDEIDVGKLTDELSDVYLDSMKADGLRESRLGSVLKRLASSAGHLVAVLTKEINESKFEPRFFELPIKDGAEGYPSASEFMTEDGRVVKVIGFIDRVDVYEGNGGIYVKVIDYKTGSKAFSPDDLDKGRNLQMFLYLKSVVESKDKKFLESIGAADGKRLIPAGVVYIKNDINDIKVQPDGEELEWMRAFESAQKHEGMILSDPEVIVAMGKYAPVKFSSSGSPTKTSANKLYTEEEWQTLMDKVENAVKRVADGITHGVISAKPMKTKREAPCEYCEFKPVCRNAAKK